MLPLSHLQFAIIDVLSTREKPGIEIRAELAKRYNVKKSLSAFYNLMMRLEDAGFLVGRYELMTVNGYRAKQRHYKVTCKGLNAWHVTRDHYINASADIGKRERVQ